MNEEKIKNNQRYLLDTSAIMTLSEDEIGADMISDILTRAESGKIKVYMSFISIMEACYKVHQHKGEQVSKNMFNYLHHLPVKRIDVNNDLILSASFIKAEYSVSMADAWILATAKYLRAQFVHKDPEFEQLKDLIPQVILPYK